LQATYTARFNARHRRSGHLFQGRFKAQLVEADEYARWLVEYVHLNPVRPRRKHEPIGRERAAELDRYVWSSHRDYTGLQRKAPDWLCLDWLAYWGRTVRAAQAEYRKRMRQAFGQPVSNPWQQLRRGLVLGGETLLEKAERLLEKKSGLEEARWTETEQAATRREQIRERLRRETDDRVKIWARVRLGGERGVDLAREYGYNDGSGVTRVVKRLETAAAHDPRLRSKLARLRSELSIVNR
jgi:putative transposase